MSTRLNHTRALTITITLTITIIIIIIIILAYFYCAAYTGMKVIESPTDCDRKCITKLVNSHRRV